MGSSRSSNFYSPPTREAMIAIQWNPERKQLRHFAGIWFPAFCGLVGWLIGAKSGHWAAVQVGWAICGVQALAGLINPAAIRPVFVGLILLTYPIGWVVSHLLLGAIFYLLFTPIGLVLRITGHDPLQLKPPAGNSLWKTPVGKTDPASYVHQS